MLLSLIDDVSLSLPLSTSNEKMSSGEDKKNFFKKKRKKTTLAITT